MPQRVQVHIESCGVGFKQAWNFAGKYEAVRDEEGAC